jgi:hypothetical protein
VQSDGQALSPAQPRGATVAFDSLDGLPPGQFRKLVQNLNEEVQARRLAVIYRAQSSAYRVHGYLAVKVAKHQTTVSWVWDVFDQDEHRASHQEETAKVRSRDAWAAADDAMLGRIARSSMEELAAFLTSPSVAPGLRRRPATRKWQWLTRRTRHPKRRKYSACYTHWPILCRRLLPRPLSTMPNPFLCRPGGRRLPPWVREALTLAAPSR